MFKLRQAEEGVLMYIDEAERRIGQKDPTSRLNIQWRV